MTVKFKLKSESLNKLSSYADTWRPVNK